MYEGKNENKKKSSYDKKKKNSLKKYGNVKNKCLWGKIIAVDRMTGIDSVEKSQ